jgi:hypothetical protein
MMLMGDKDHIKQWRTDMNEEKVMEIWSKTVLQLQYRYPGQTVPLKEVICLFADLIRRHGY